jgi:hypothetical protein
MRGDGQYIDHDAALNKDTEEWSREVVGDMLDNISRLGIVGTGKLYRMLRYKLGYDVGGVVDRVGIQMLRHGIMAEYGVGRGQKIADVKGGGKALKRKPRPWFGPALAGRVGKLADILAANRADAVVSAVDISNKKIGAK